MGDDPGRLKDEVERMNAAHQGKLGPVSRGGLLPSMSPDTRRVMAEASERYYCWRAGSATAPMSDGRCPECGGMHDHVIAAGICGRFDPSHGGPCYLRTDHAGDCDANAVEIRELPEAI